ncbi:MAG: S24/S26 family peptidase [Elusimicrobiota bacterium]|nr:S24/S26 family peptidase [Elusimicrobiota bacterium]
MYLKVKTTGGSMRPLINSGEIVYIERVSPGEISPGDCIAYKVNDKLYLHRLISIQDIYLTVIDDANIVGKIKIPLGSFIGKMVDKRILLHGYIGLAFSYFANLVFRIFRPIKISVEKIYQRFTFF